MKRATIERKTRSIDCFLHRCLIARHRALSAKLPTLIVKTWHSSVRMVCVWLLVWLSEFGVLLNCCILSNQFDYVMKLIRARNTSRHDQPLNMATHKITRRVTTHVDDNDWCGDCARIRIHSCYHTMHHICSTNVDEPCTSKLATALYIAQFRWISELTDRCSLVYPQDFTLTNVQSLEYLGIFNKTGKPPFFGFPKNGGFSKFLEIQFFGCRATLFDPKIKFVHHEFQYVRLVGACIVMMYMRTDRVYQCMHQPLVHPLARCIHVVAGI